MTTACKMMPSPSRPLLLLHVVHSFYLSFADFGLGISEFGHRVQVLYQAQRGFQGLLSLQAVPDTWLQLELPEVNTLVPFVLDGVECSQIRTQSSTTNNPLPPLNCNVHYFTSSRPEESCVFRRSGHRVGGNNSFFCAPGWPQYLGCKYFAGCGVGKQRWASE